MLATGQLSPNALYGNVLEADSMYGLEFAGRDSQGKRVMGTVTSLALATTCKPNPDFLWPVPDEWTLEQATTIPVAYGTAYLALCIRGNIQRGESILIHSGSGAVGIASINICLHAGLKVFVTVGSEEKRKFLKTKFPQLTDK